MLAAKEQKLRPAGMSHAGCNQRLKISCAVGDTCKNNQEETAKCASLDTRCGDDWCCLKGKTKSRHNTTWHMHWAWNSTTRALLLNVWRCCSLSVGAVGLHGTCCQHRKDLRHV